MLVPPRYFDKLLEHIDQAFYERIKHKRAGAINYDLGDTTLLDEDLTKVKKIIRESSIIDKELI